MTPKKRPKKTVDRSNRAVLGPGYETFEEAFPDVKSLRFEYIIHSDVATTEGPHIMTIKSFQPIITCTNRACLEGGFEVDIELSRKVFSGKLEHYEGWIYCSGYERLGRHRRQCGAMLEYKVDVEYKT